MENKLINRLEKRDIKLRVIITGRELIIQGVRNKFHQVNQIIHIIPYNIDQRNMYWNNFTEYTKLIYTGFPKELDENIDKEITFEPLFIYLIALNHDKYIQILVNKGNINLFYLELIINIYEHRWLDNSLDRHPSVKFLSNRDFINILQATAIAMWHGEDDYAR